MILHYYMGGGMLLLYGFCAAVETAFFRVDRPFLMACRNRSDVRAAHLERFYLNTTRFYHTLLIGRILALTCMAALVVAAPVNRQALPLLGIGVMFFVGGIYLPKLAAVRWPGPLLLAFTPLIRLLYLLFTPGYLLLQASVKLLHTRAQLPVPVPEAYELQRRSQHEEEVRRASELDDQVLSNAVELKKARVREIMIPRTEIVALPEEVSLPELLDKFIETELSRILIYRNTLDEMVGYVHSQALLRRPKVLAEVLQPLLVVPDTMPATALLQQFNVYSSSLALAVDEFGGTGGLVTLDDVVDEVFGGLEDEYDVAELHVEEAIANGFRFSARLEVDYLNEAYHLALPTGPYSTLGGLVLHIAERIPEPGESFEAGNYHFTVLSAHRNKLEVVEVGVPTSTSIEGSNS